MRPTLLLAAALICFGASFADEVEAGSLEISPVLVNFAPGQTATTIEVRNRGGAPAAVQARAFTWSQTGDQDSLTPTQDIILSPPIFTVPEGGSQTMRLLLRGAASSSAERSYRLLLDEVPSAATRNRQVVIALRMSLPVIVPSAASATSPPTKLQWRVERSGDGQIALTALNSGQSYDRVSAIEVTLPDGSHPKVASTAKNPYVLAGGQRRWILQSRGGVPGGALHLNVTTLAGKSEQVLTTP